jgi:hypothetical protein
MNIEASVRSLSSSSPACNQSRFSKPLAVLFGAAVIGSYAFLGYAASQCRMIFLDFGAELPAATSAIVATPFIVYLAAGAILGGLAAWTIWAPHGRLNAVLIVSAVVAVIALWIGIAASLASSMMGIVRDLS